MATKKTPEEKAKAKADKLKEDLLKLPLYIEDWVSARIGGPLMIMNRKSPDFEQQYEDCYVTGIKDPKIVSKVAKHPETLWKNAPHAINVKKGIYGFPAVGLKKAMIREFKNSSIPMIDAKGLFRVDGPMYYDPDTVVRPKRGLFELESYEYMENRRDFVLRDGKKTGLEYRVGFVNWTAWVDICFDSSILTLDRIIAILASAGNRTGLASGRGEIEDAGIFKVLEVNPDVRRKKIKRVSPLKVGKSNKKSKVA